MPSEPVIVTLRDDMVDALNLMSEAEGYWYDYAPVVIDARAVWQAETDFTRPTPFLDWTAPDPGESIFSTEEATSRHRRFDGFDITMAIQDPEDVMRKAWRVERDVHKALISTGRNRGQARAATFTGPPDWQSIHENGKPVGGLLTLPYFIRWDFVTGDMTTMG